MSECVKTSLVTGLSLGALPHENWVIGKMAMNFDGMNGSDMDTSDSRKRPLDTDIENGVTKRSNQGAGENIHLKILVPSIAAGAIIGKGGETIAQVQKEAGARVKMSKANDFYPGKDGPEGTTERVCLIMGSIDAVRKIHSFIMEKIREKPDPNPKPEDSKSSYERHRQVKILVPNSTAGMIIGKAGNFIKQIKEESGAYVQISQKSKETNLPERCVTVAGELDANKKAVDMILQKIAEDPQSGSCPNISYADYTGPVASANPTGSPFANTNFLQNRTTEVSISNNGFNGNNLNFGFNGSTFNNSISGGMPSLNISALSGAATGGNMSNGAMDNLKLTLRNSGYNEQATEEISVAMSTLANYGILGMGLGLGIGSFGNVQSIATGTTGLNQLALSTPPLGVSSMITNTTTTVNNAGTNTFLNASSSSTTGGSLFGPVGSGSSGLGSSGSTGASSSLFGSSSPSIANERYVGSPMLNDSFSSAPTYSSPTAFASANVPAERSPSISVNVNQNSFGLGTGMYSPTDDKAVTTKQDLEVPENIVGAILGPGGKGIVELQQFTGTNIQISKKGVYVPGTRNRIVTITGTPQNISRAQYMIQQRIQQEELKRARQAQNR